MNQFDGNLTKSLEDFMESYKMVDVEQIYSNGTEFVPIFRVKQWLEYNNINNLQSKIDKANEMLGGLLKEAYYDGEYIQYDYSTNDLLELKDILKEE